MNQWVIGLENTQNKLDHLQTMAHSPLRSASLAPPLNRPPLIAERVRLDSTPSITSTSNCLADTQRHSNLISQSPTD